MQIIVHFPFFSPFKFHMELELTDEQISTLVQGNAKFTTEVAAEDLPNSQWLTDMSNFPKVNAKSFDKAKRLVKNVKAYMHPVHSLLFPFTTFCVASLSYNSRMEIWQVITYQDFHTFL